MREDGDVAQVGNLRSPGHGFKIEQKPNGKWIATCECGYVCAVRMTEALALGAAVIHLRKVKAQLRADGVSTTVRHRIG